MTEGTATAILSHEHEVILLMLDATEEVARLLDRGDEVSPETLDGLLEFFRVFADRCHYGKEEALLLPKLEKRGLRRDAGPTGAMLQEHEQGRWLLREMAAAALAYAAGNAEARLSWIAAARGYAHLLRQHIAKENEVLFPIAEKLLTEAEQREIAAGFDKVEEETMGTGTHGRLHNLMEKLLAEIMPT
jgi:hemerythrin-like domain-containing protein